MIIRIQIKHFLQTVCLLLPLAGFTQSFEKADLINSALIGFFSIDRADSLMKKNSVKEMRKVVVVGSNVDTIEVLSFDKEARLIKKKIWHKNMPDTILLKIQYTNNKKLRFEYSLPQNTVQHTDVLQFSNLMEALMIDHKDVTFSCEVEVMDNSNYNLRIHINSKLYLDTSNVNIPWFETNKYDSLSFGTISSEHKDGESVIVRTERSTGDRKYINRDSLSSSGKLLKSLGGLESGGEIRWSGQFNYYYDINTDSLIGWENVDLVNNTLIESKDFTYDEFHKLSAASTLDYLNKSCQLLLFENGRLKQKLFSCLAGSAWIPRPFFVVTAYKYLDNDLLMEEVTTMNNQFLKSVKYGYYYWQ